VKLKLKLIKHTSTTINLGIMMVAYVREWNMRKPADMIDTINPGEKITPAEIAVQVFQIHQVIFSGQQYGTFEIETYMTSLNVIEVVPLAQQSQI